MTIEQIYKEYFDELKNIYHEKEAANITDWVFENITGIKRIDRALNKQKQLSITTIEQLYNALEQLLKHKPIQYILSEAWFYKMKLFVNEHVLIPRPETEELVEWIVEDVRNTKYDVEINEEVRSTKYEVRNIKASLSPFTTQTLNIIDIGTGSGCIALALKKELVNASILGIDVSAEALSVAKQNATDQNIDINLSWMNFLDESNWHDLPVFNIIVSNPPYIPENEKNILEKNVVAYEPHSALFVNDDDRFIFYKKMAEFAVKHLDTKGKIYVEVHEKYSVGVAALFSEFHFVSIIKKDIYGKERMIRAER
ncbi:MAG: peptide chain release factor N(5)-glutamine methyltransferase [Ginsengibacter sp.]